jgi:hypothetical protein
MDGMLIHDLIWAVCMALAGGIVFSGVGLISGTDETSTIAPLTLLIILLGVPPVAVFSWFMAAAISKHMIHADSNGTDGCSGRYDGGAHVRRCSSTPAAGRTSYGASQMISGGIIAAFLALPISVVLHPC